MANNKQKTIDELSVEFNKLKAGVPKKYHALINKIHACSHQMGAMYVLEMVQMLGYINPKEITDYGIYHNDDIAGG